MQNVGIVGLGNMGRGMLHSLRRGGFETFGYDVLPEIRDRLASEGFTIVSGIEELCRLADVLILSLPTAAIVEDVVTDTAGILAHATAGMVVVDTSTSHPETSRCIAARLAGKGIGFIDAPVSGGPKGAMAGTMTMVIGGSDADISEVEPILSAMSAKRVHVGPVGAGHVTKIINNLLCAAHLLTGAEAMRLAVEAGVEPDRVMEGINAGSGRSGVTMVNFPTWIFNEAYDSGFTMKLMRKDVALGAQLMSELGLSMPMAEHTTRIWSESLTRIADDEDFNRIVSLQITGNKGKGQ
ncbi:MmsB 3-hydroxyisobutyrate dehydrogenase and related beta-hydroxyacid dehydrogenases [Rhabdaerophilaceae bacterium]